MKYAVMSATGIPTVLADAEHMPEGAMHLPDSADLTAMMRQMLVEGAWQDRPAAILNRTAETPVTITLSEAPPGAAVRIFDIDGDELLFEGLVSPGAFWTFADPGRYAVEVEPPAPWLPATLCLEVPS